MGISCLQALPLISQTTRRTPCMGSVIDTGIPEMTTDERAVGAHIG